MSLLRGPMLIVLEINMPAAQLKREAESYRRESPISSGFPSSKAFERERKPTLQQNLKPETPVIEQASWTRTAVVWTAVLTTFGGLYYVAGWAGLLAVGVVTIAGLTWLVSRSLGDTIDL